MFFRLREKKKPSCSWVKAERKCKCVGGGRNSEASSTLVTGIFDRLTGLVRVLLCFCSKIAFWTMFFFLFFRGDIERHRLRDRQAGSRRIMYFTKKFLSTKSAQMFYPLV